MKKDTVEMIWTANTRDHFLKKGYTFTNSGDSFIVKVSDLQVGSHKEINLICDYCFSEFNRSYRRMLESNSCYTIKKDCCNKCFKYKNIEQKLFEYDICNGEKVISHMLNNNINKLSGVYKIRNIINKKNYIGSSIDILNRWEDHKNELSKGTHISRSLMNEYREYGVEAFEFSILEFDVEKSKLVILEHEYIREYASDELDYGYNTVSIFKTNKNKLTNNVILNENNIIEIKKRITNKESHRAIANHFKVTKSAISDIKNGQSWSNVKTPYDESISNSNVGKRIGESNGCSKLTENDVRNIKYKLKEGQRLTSIGKEFGVSRTLISYIKNGKLWSHIS